MPNEIRKCQNCKKEFVIEPDDFDFYKKMGVPAPVFCPDCRMKGKLVWRNERTFYKRTCELCKKSIITIYHPRYLAPIYCFDCWQSDKWDTFAYGVSHDSTRPFFEQLGKLILRVPKAATHIGTAGLRNINSEYMNFAGGNKDCYLIFNSTENENCGHSRGIIKCKDTFDTYFANQTELCYEGINVNKSNKTLWGQNVSACVNSYFLLNCVGLQNCFGCVNLRYKSYYFFNEPFSKDDWTKRVSEIFGSYQEIEKARKRFKEFSLKFPKKENNNLKTVNCTGDYITESKNCFDCFEAFGCEDCKYGFSIKLTKDSYDMVGRGVKSELLLETVAGGHNCSRIIGSWSTEASRNVEYSYDLRACEDCFGCVGLKHAKYCILNKKYSEQEYKKIREQIINELKDKDLYGLYLPPELSPWAYNETLAQEFFPLSKEETLAQGFRWEDEIFQTRGQETLKPDRIPDRIQDVSDSILDKILVCVNCGRNYRLIKSELEFYRKMLIPIPRKCFNCRHLERVARRGPLKVYSRICQKCGKSIRTTFAPNRPEIVYCEECYLKEVV
jgi:hypothetical protein